MIPRTIYVFVLLVTVFISGCASIVSDRHYPVSFTSSQQDVHFEITNADGMLVQSGKTPSTLTLKAENGYFSRARYTVKWIYANGDTKQTQLKASIDGWYFGNIIFGGLVGLLIVDPLTGAMWRLPETYHDAYTNTVNKITKKKEKQVTFMNIDTIPLEYRDKLIPVM